MTPSTWQSLTPVNSPQNSSHCPPLFPRFPPHLPSPLLTPLLGRHTEVTLLGDFGHSQPYTHHARGVWKQTGARTFACTHYKYSSRTWCGRHKRWGPPPSVTSTTVLHCRLTSITQDALESPTCEHTEPSNCVAVQPGALQTCLCIPRQFKTIIKARHTSTVTVPRQSGSGWVARCSAANLL